MKRKISVKQFDYDYFKKMEINNSNRILGGIGTQIDNCTYSSDTTTNDGRGSNEAGHKDDGGGNTDETTTVPKPPTTLP